MVNTALMRARAQREDAVQAAAARVIARRPDHTPASLCAQRKRISAWVNRWQTDEDFRRAVVDGAFMRMQRREPAMTSKLKQRERISAWVYRWLNDEVYRRAIVTACLPGRRFQGRGMS